MSDVIPKGMNMKDSVSTAYNEAGVPGSSVFLSAVIKGWNIDVQGSKYSHSYSIEWNNKELVLRGCTSGSFEEILPLLERIALLNGRSIVAVPKVKDPVDYHTIRMISGSGYMEIADKFVKQL